MEPVHLARVRVIQESRSNRVAYLGTFPEPIRYGVYAGIKAFHGDESAEEHPSTLDHLVGALVG